MKELKYCIVERSDRMESFINGNEVQEVVFPSLDELLLINLPNLRTIWQGVVTWGSLASLTHLKLMECNKLRKVFSLSLLQQLINLEDLKVVCCMGVEEIVGEDEDAVKLDVVALLPKLKNLILYNLPNLKTILERVVQRGSLSNPTHLKLTRCHKLRKIFSTDFLQLLVKLETLDVTSCREMEEIIGEEEVVMEHDDVLLLPKLKYIKLFNIPKLRSICKHALAWPSLQEIKVTDCPNLRRLSLSIHSSSSLTTIQGKPEWWDDLEWEDDADKYQFQHIFKPH